MDRHTGRLALIFILALVLSPLGAHAEELFSDLGFFIDLPEGWGVPEDVEDWGKTGKSGEFAFEFSDPSGSAFLSLTAYPAGKFLSAQAFYNSLKTSLKAEGDSEGFLYSGRDSVLADLSFKEGSASLRGYGVFILDGKRQYELVAYTTSSKYDAYHDFLISTIDGFSIDEAARRLPGPISQFDTPFPGKNLKKGFVEFLGKRIEISVDMKGAEACQALVEREYRILTAYSKTPNLAQAADARFYRMIYRDSYSRLAELSLFIEMELDKRLAETPLAQSGELKSSSGVPLGNADTQRARDILSWVQGFKYERDLKGSDVVNPLSAALGARGDCDARSLLMTILLHRMNIDAILMVSGAYSHAMAACDVPGGGNRFSYKDKKWLVAETTAKPESGVGLGLIARDKAEFSKWYGVDFGF